MKTYKTKPFKHQKKALDVSKDKEVFALLMEQGTGKSKVIIDTIAHLWRAGEIDFVQIIAPKGVAPGWVRQQIPTHMPDDVPYVAALWKTSMSKTRQKEMEKMLARTDVLRIVVMNTEAFGASEKAIDFSIDALDAAQSAMVVIDESHRIKTPQAKVTKRILMHVRPRCRFRRILTGTVGDKPFDLFSQFGFLDPAIIGVDSFTAFKGEYAEMIPPESGAMRHIAARLMKLKKGGPLVHTGKYYDEETGALTDQARSADGIKNKPQMLPKFLPQLVATNPDGTPRYRDLDKLQRLVAPHSYRVLKADCLDLPEKLYNRYYTELTDQQWSLYNEVKEEQRIEWEEGRVSVFNKLTVYLRLQQIICGYIPDDDRLVELFKSWGENPRICSTLELIGDRPDGERAIIWCRFREDIRRMAQALKESYGSGSVVEFHGGVSDRDRIENVARFQGVRENMDKKGNFISSEEVPEAERARFMIAQQQSGGVGQTWTAANLSLHYSNMFSLIDRLQAEDRPHRIGQKRAVQYIDIEAEDTIDSVIIGSLVAKKEVADVLNGDEGSNWLKL